MENNKTMSDKEQSKQRLDAVKNLSSADYNSVDEALTESMSGMRSRIANFKIDLKERAAGVDKKSAEPKYTKIAIADRAIDAYKTNVNPAIQEPDGEKENIHISTNASRHNVSAVARSLAGLRNGGNAGKMTQTTPNGNGDLGQYTSPASSNGGDLGNNTAYGQYYALTTNMTLEQYQAHINEKFGFDWDEKVERTPPVCGVCGCDPCECGEVIEESPVDDLKDELREMTDYSWQAIDTVMRKIAREYDITPKQLHKDFKAEEGMIPDEWAKVNEETQLCGYMPLDEAQKIMKVGQVYEVSCIWRGKTMRIKFFWPAGSVCSREDCQNCCDMFYPGSKLLAYYPVNDNPENYMVIVPPMKENYEFVPQDTWEELNEEADAFYNFICEEVGEPLSPMILHENGEYHMVIEDHDTGDEKLINVNEEGLHSWFNSSKSKDGKPGWVNVVTGGTCASDKKGEGTPKCVSSSKRASMSKSERQSAASRKKAADPGQQSKSGAAKPTYVSTDKKTKKEEFEPVDEACWKTHKQVGMKMKGGKMVPDCKPKGSVSEENVDEACWKGYKKKGMKKMFGKMYPNCVKEGGDMENAPSIKDAKPKKSTPVKYDKHMNVMAPTIKEGDEMKGLTQKGGHKRSTESGAGLTQKGVDAVNRKTGGNLKTAVTTPPSKLKPGSKAAGRRKSFCARSRGWNGERGKAARRRWNC